MKQIGSLQNLCEWKSSRSSEQIQFESLKVATLQSSLDLSSLWEDRYGQLEEGPSYTEERTQKTLPTHT